MNYRYNSLILAMIYLIFLLNIASCQVVVTRKYGVRGNLGVEVAITNNFTLGNTTNPVIGLTVQTRTRAKHGVTYIQIDGGDRRTCYVFWRDINFQLAYQHLTLNSTRDRFYISPLEKDSIFDFTPGGRYFDYLFDVSDIWIDVNLTQWGRRLVRNLTISMSTIRINRGKDFSQLREYSGMLWEDSTVFVYDGMIPGPYYILYFIRWEAYHPGFYAGSLFITVVILVLVFLFAGKQPLKSRGIVPYLVGAFQIMVLLFCLFNWLASIETLTVSRCYVRIFFFYPTFLSIVLVGAQTYLRYNLLQILSNRKEKVLEGKVTHWSSKGKLIRFYEFLQRPITQLIIFVLFYLVNVIIFLCAHVISQMGNINSNDCKVLDNVYYIMIVVTLFFMYVNFPLAVFLSWNDIRTLNFQNIFIRDHLRFKFEIYILYTLTFLYVFSNQILFSWLRYALNSPFHIVMISFQHHMLFFTQAIYPLVMTMLDYFIFLCFGSKSKSLLEEILKDPKGLQIFYNYSKTEFAVENVSCYDDISIYENANDVKTKGHMALQIYNLYLNGSKSELEINISHLECKYVKEQIDQQRFTNELFTVVKTTVLANLADTYSRLIRTDTYKEYVNERAFYKEWKLNEPADDVELKRSDTVVAKYFFTNSSKELKEPLLEW